MSHLVHISKKVLHILHVNDAHISRNCFAINQRLSFIMIQLA